jgi:phosphoribosylanthranilate isomerase
MRFKVCGISGASAERDIEMLAAAGVDLVGLWHGVGGGDAELSLAELVHLAAAARRSEITPVLVTFERDPRTLAVALRASGVTWVQLHGYQLPSAVRELKALLGNRALEVVKVLHTRADGCVDARLARAYERAGVDAFLLDVTDGAGRVGSTGVPIRAEVALAVVGRLTRPFFLAGGISASARRRYDELASHEGFAGIDVSSAARDRAGRLDAARIESIGRAWRAGATLGSRA